MNRESEVEMCFCSHTMKDAIGFFFLARPYKIKIYTSELNEEMLNDYI